MLIMKTISIQKKKSKIIKKMCLPNHIKELMEKPQGRKRCDVKDNNKSRNILMHYPFQPTNHVLLTQKTINSKPSLKETKFHKGFQRRQINDIWPNFEQKKAKQREQAELIRENHEIKRRDFLQTKMNANGNTILGGYINKER
ncbi:hypothetical protein RFI_09729 [Reticulomyxa filosa]|uniref:Uncharacterized protein n=1 Tax=Reticulomyxa filosa TaxID=46433 RepID=X6NNA9_RETFI|nr:hypothetical protein RFI_09729 [Reticulomyxa filosa]|eukprot:ETO27403.1 hypothetical protein RFI_09729 [Reticulomyxa filosa]